MTNTEHRHNLPGEELFLGKIRVNYYSTYSGKPEPTAVPTLEQWNGREWVYICILEGGPIAPQRHTP
jgi:hypothetical protein